MESRVKLPRFLHRPKNSRGQAMVEMALILPLLALLLVMSIDFGRVFFGRVALENAARIGADFAASHASAWNGDAPDDGEQDALDLYRRQIAQDLQSLNCQLAGNPADPIEDRVPAPNFDPDGDGVDDFSDSALVQVKLDCAFELLTPLAESALGGPITLHADALFAINGTMHTGLAGGAPPPPPPPGACDPPIASFTTVPPKSAGGRVNIPSNTNVTFTDTSTAEAGCAIAQWVWAFGDGSTGSGPSPVTHLYVYGGSGPHTNYTAVLTVTNTGGSDTETITVRVAKP
jgi:TadE-like protein/PKD domain-containing protein